MSTNLTPTQIVLIVIGIILLIWLFSWLMRPKIIIQQPFSQVDLNAGNGYGGSQGIQGIANDNSNQASQLSSQPSIQSASIQTPSSLPVPPPAQPAYSDGPLEYGTSDSPFVLYYFHSPTCGHCKRFSPNWDDVVRRFDGTSGIWFKPINLSDKDQEGQRLKFYFDVRGVPKIVMITDKNDYTYEGNRTPDDVYNFVIGHLQESAQQ